MQNEQRKRQTSRSRLVATAHDLFTSRGASNVGINELTKIADVARMSLYSNFLSKEALVLTVYEEMVDDVLKRLKDLDDFTMSEEQRVFSTFDFISDYIASGKFRGCPFIHASLQDADPIGPVYKLVQRYKRSLYSHLFGLLNEDRVNRDELATQLLMLIDGASTESYLEGSPGAAKWAKLAASRLLRQV